MNFDHDEAARSAGVGAREAERESERSRERAREAGPPRSVRMKVRVRARVRTPQARLHPLLLGPAKHHDKHTGLHELTRQLTCHLTFCYSLHASIES